MTTQTATGAHRRARRALAAWGLWLRAGLVGVIALAAGPWLAINGDIRATTAMALVLGGAMLAALSWSRLRTALVPAHAPEAERADAHRGVADRGPGHGLRHAGATSFE